MDFELQFPFHLKSIISDSNTARLITGKFIYSARENLYLLEQVKQKSII